MDSGRGVRTEVEQAWRNLNAAWKDDISGVFYSEYVLKLSQSADDFDLAAAKIDQAAQQLEDKLLSLEQEV